MGRDDFLIAFQSTTLGVSTELVREASDLLTLLRSCRILRSPVHVPEPSATETIGKDFRSGGGLEMTAE